MDRKEQIKKIIELRKQGKTWSNIASTLQVSNGSVYRIAGILKKAGIITEPVKRKTDQKIIEELLKEKIG